MLNNRDSFEFFTANYFKFKTHVDDFEKLKKTLEEYENYDKKLKTQFLKETIQLVDNKKAQLVEDQQRLREEVKKDKQAAVSRVVQMETELQEHKRLLELLKK